METIILVKPPEIKEQDEVRKSLRVGKMKHIKSIE